MHPSEDKNMRQMEANAEQHMCLLIRLWLTKEGYELNSATDEQIKGDLRGMPGRYAAAAVRKGDSE